MSTPPIIIESPYRATEKYTQSDNEFFASNLCRHYAMIGFNPIASHVYYTTFLSDTVPNERVMGMTMGLQLATSLRPNFVVFALREGETELTEGMVKALKYWKEQQIQGIPRLILTHWRYPKSESGILPIAYQPL